MDKKLQNNVIISKKKMLKSNYKVDTDNFQAKTALKQFFFIQ